MDRYEPAEAALRQSNARLKIRLRATEILRNTPGIMTMAEAMEQAKKEVESLLDLGEN